MRSVTKALRCAAVLCGVLLPIHQVQAQQTTPVPVTEDAYQALGLKTGAFTVYPSIETGVEATDNVSSSSSDRREDAGVYVEPTLRIESDWVRHSVGAQFSSRHLYYFRTPTENTLDADVSANARIDVLSTTQIDLDASYSLEQEGRGSVDVPGAAAEPPNTHSIDASAAVTHQMGRTQTRLTGTFGYNIYEDVDLVGGGVTNNTDRNYVEAGGELRLGYDVSPRIQPFVEGGFTVREHAQEVDDSGLRRDSVGFTAGAGVRVEMAPTLTGEASIGYVTRDFEDTAIATVEAFTFDADLTWRLSSLTTIGFSGSTEVEETSFGTSGGAVTHRIGASIDHALRRHFLAGMDVSYTLRDFAASALSEETFNFAAGFTYQFNREWALQAGYSFTRFDSTAAGSDYTVNAATVGLLWQK